MEKEFSSLDDTPETQQEGAKPTQKRKRSSEDSSAKRKKTKRSSEGSSAKSKKTKGGKTGKAEKKLRKRLRTFRFGVLVHLLVMISVHRREPAHKCN